MAKTPNIKKHIGNNCNRGPKVHFIPIFRPIGPFPYFLLHFSSKNFFFNTFFKIAKNYHFWSKKGHFSADFAEILGIDEKHVNTSYVKILGHLGHYLAKITIFGHFWPILAYIII